VPGKKGQAKKVTDEINPDGKNIRKDGIIMVR
jgi:hypothetical protein